MSGTKHRSTAGAMLGALVVFVAAVAPASAHPRDTTLLYLDVTESSLGGRVEVPFADIETQFGVELGESADDVRTNLRANLPEIQEYLLDHTTLRAAETSEEWAVVFDDVRLLADSGDEDGFAVFPFTVDLETEAVPRTLAVTFDPFFDDIDGRESIVLVGNDWLGGVIEAESNRLVLFNPGSRSAVVDLGDTSQWKNFTASVGAGVEHLRTGADHIFFILVLLLPSVLVFTTEWNPAARFGRSLWKVLKIAGMFTLAHSITFTLAGLEILPVPSAKVVESVIAVSIAVAALHNLRPVFRNREWALAFIFGLFHGMGFASLVDALDISRQTQLVSLIGRNVGIEIGQSVLIVLAFPILFLIRDTRIYRPLFVAGSIMLAVIALAWTIERILEVDFGTNTLTAGLIAWPRLLWIVLAALVIAAVVRGRESSAGRLLDTVE